MADSVTLVEGMTISFNCTANGEPQPEISWTKNGELFLVCLEGERPGRKEGREGWKEGGREGRTEGGREGEREGGREREVGREGERERGMEIE